MLIRFYCPVKVNYTLFCGEYIAAIRFFVRYVIFNFINNHCCFLFVNIPNSFAYKFFGVNLEHSKHI